LKKTSHSPLGLAQQKTTSFASPSVAIVGVAVVAVVAAVAAYKTKFIKGSFVEAAGVKVEYGAAR